MPKLPEIAPIPDKPPVHLKGGAVVVASPESITEACFCVPAVRALRNARPHASIAVLTPDSIAPLWNSVLGLNDLITYPDAASVKEIVEILKAGPFNAESSLAWEASNAAVALAKAKVAQRLGYDFKPLNKRLTDKLKITGQNGPVEHRVRYYMGLVEQLGIEGYVAKSFETPPLPPRPDPVRIGLVPGSILGASYRWNIDRFRELGESLLKNHQVELIILSYPGRANEANQLAERFDGNVKNLADEFDLGGLLNALPHCSLLVSNDGAVTHLASHLGLPTVALFGPGDPVTTRPLGRQHIVLSQHLDCSPCNQPSCPLDHHRCMEELTVARVYEAVTASLQPQPTTSA
jgi:ADP-heptose:LPS heptosyltransferase